MEALGDFRPSTAYTRELGDEVRDVRTQSGLSLTKLAEGLGWSSGKLSKLENGRRGADTVDLIRLVGYCHGDQAALDRVLDIAREGERGFLIRTHLDGVPDGLRALIASERKAATITTFEPNVIPGMLQTPEYARALMMTSGDPAVEAGVMTRMERQELLRRPEPPECTFFIHEAAMHGWVGGSRVMADQMLQLALWSGWGHVTIRLVPFAVGNRQSFLRSFRYMSFTANEPVIYTEGHALSVWSERPEVVAAHKNAINDIDGFALDAQESRSEFARWADRYDRLRGHHDPEGPRLA
ncbi:MAG: helix-turn-helix transcriptional regulator [Umezawaea sp.]